MCSVYNQLRLEMFSLLLEKESKGANTRTSSYLKVLLLGNSVPFANCHHFLLTVLQALLLTFSSERLLSLCEVTSFWGYSLTLGILLCDYNCQIPLAWKNSSRFGKREREKEILFNVFLFCSMTAKQHWIANDYKWTYQQVWTQMVFIHIKTVLDYTTNKR